ncbi:uncharacterized protein LOC110403968 isoform X2 [Numida meleagris]|uniref:uncharacterized protein LOC110403968 isoform X2 n=1 Tax=Numida meleagris TaxID=8996 RepID=UPI000B3DF707|nr:uncharacterized protein LOC110403968 isoform X2 [Numida meleagris]
MPPGGPPGLGTAAGPPRSCALVLVLVAVLGARPEAARSVPRQRRHEHSPSPGSSWWDVEHEGLLHSQSTLPGAVGPSRPSPLLHPNAGRSSLSQNLGQKSQEKQLSCDVLLKLSRYILMDTFRPGLAWNLFRLYNCDREAKLPKMHVGPLKMARHKLRPSLLHRMLRLLGNMGMLSEGQQHKVFALLKEHMLQARKMSPKPKEEHSGRYP